MNDVDLVAIRVTQIGAKIAVSVMRAWPRTSFIRAAMRKAAGMGRLHRLFRQCQKGDHAAVANRGRLAVERAIDRKPGQRGVCSYPAKRRRPAIRGNDPLRQTEQGKHGIVEVFRPLKITRSDGHMAEHSILQARRMIAARRKVWISISLVIA